MTRGAGTHDYDPEDDEQIFAPRRGHEWEHNSGPSGKPYVQPQSERGRHEAAVNKEGWSGWGPSLFPKTRKVAGWDWDDHLNGYLSDRPRHFTCECNRKIATPSGFHRCKCGKQWNSYVVGTGGSNREAAADKFLVREIPVRKDVILAGKNQPRSSTAASKRHRVDNYGMDDGEDVEEPTFSKRIPKDWSRRDKGGRWTTTVGKA